MKRGQPLNKGQIVSTSHSDSTFVTSEKRTTSLQGAKDPPPSLSLVERLHCIRDKGPTPNVSLVERLHCSKVYARGHHSSIKDIGPSGSSN